MTEIKLFNDSFNLTSPASLIVHFYAVSSACNFKVLTDIIWHLSTMFAIIDEWKMYIYQSYTSPKWKCCHIDAIFLSLSTLEIVKMTTFWCIYSDENCDMMTFPLQWSKQKIQHHIECTRHKSIHYEQKAWTKLAHSCTTIHTNWTMPNLGQCPPHHQSYIYNLNKISNISQKKISKSIFL